MVQARPPLPPLAARKRALHRLNLCGPIHEGELTSKLLINMVGTTGFEPATSSVSRKRSNQLSYAPLRATRISLSGSGQRRKTMMSRPLAMLYHHSLMQNTAPYADGACRSRMQLTESGLFRGRARLALE
jgi:hypothetical protein